MRTKLTTLFRRFSRDDRGVTLVEYGIALILAITVGGTILTGLGTATSGQMTEATELMD